MDLTLPYTFYPSVLPHWMSWGLFLLAVGRALAASLAISRFRKPWVGVVLFAPVLVGLLIVTMVCSMVVAFVIHH